MCMLNSKKKKKDTSLISPVIYTPCTGNCKWKNVGENYIEYTNQI